MKLAIMQPTYLPWAGYFNLITEADIFVFLDDVKFEKCSWHTRNRVLTNGNVAYITVPTQGSRVQNLNEVLICSTSSWRRKHSRLLQQTYGKCAGGQAMLDIILPIINDTSIYKLAELNIKIITKISKEFGLNHMLVQSSNLSATGKRSEYLINIYNEVGASSYLSPVGSKDYIEEDGLFDDINISVEYQDYNPSNYTQPHNKKFVSHLSIVDVIANVGKTEAGGYVL